MKKIILGSIILLISTCLFAQSVGNAIYNTKYESFKTTNVNILNHNQVDIQADIMINMKATSYTAIFSVTQNGLTSAITDSLMDIRLNTVKAGLLESGIKKDNIHIDVISFVPIYSLELKNKKFSKTINEIPVGFQMKKNIHILFYNHDQLSNIIALMAKSEIYDIVKVDYNLADIQAAHNELRKAALEVIKTKKELYKELGLHLEVQNMADGFGSAYPIERYSNYTAFHMGSSVEEVKAAKRRKKYARDIYVNGKNAKVSIKGRDIDDTKYIIRRSEKNKTIYYKKIAYNKFDLVLNADFTEARIQIYYTLKVRHTVVNAEKHNKIVETQKIREEKAKEREDEIKSRQKKKRWFR